MKKILMTSILTLAFMLASPLAMVFADTTSAENKYLNMPALTETDIEFYKEVMPLLETYFVEQNSDDKQKLNKEKIDKVIEKYGYDSERATYVLAKISATEAFLKDQITENQFNEANTPFKPSNEEKQLVSEKLLKK